MGKYIGAPESVEKSPRKIKTGFGSVCVETRLDGGLGTCEKQKALNS